MEPETAVIKIHAKRFSANVRKERQASGLTLRVLSQRANVTQQAISAIEHGGGVSLDVAVRLCDALGTSLKKMLEP